MLKGKSLLQKAIDVSAVPCNKGTIHSKSKILIFPVACSAICLSLFVEVKVVELVLAILKYNGAAYTQQKHKCGTF